MQGQLQGMMGPGTKRPPPLLNSFPPFSSATPYPVLILLFLSLPPPGHEEAFAEAEAMAAAFEAEMEAGGPVPLLSITVFVTVWGLFAETREMRERGGEERRNRR
eukprot:3099061-Rhodomonas_salina.4